MEALFHCVKIMSIIYKSLTLINYFNKFARSALRNEPNIITMTVLPWRHFSISIAIPMLLVLCFAIVASLIGGGIERSLIVFFISLTVVAGMGVYSGNSGILSFGHLSFMAIGAYASAILTLPVEMKKLTLPNLPDFLGSTQLDFFPSMIVATLFVMLVALFIGLLISRLDGSAATIATLALLIIVHGVIIGARDYTRGSQSFFGVPRETDIWIAGAVCAFALVASRIFRDSVPGLKLRASREDAIAARSNGVGIRNERLLAWVLSAGLVALAGIVLGHYLGAFSPKKFYFVDTFALLAMLIVGGMSTMTGAVVGAIVITLVTEVLRRLEGGIEVLGIQFPEVFGMTQIGIGLVILFVMFKRPDGLAGLREFDEKLGLRFIKPEQPPKDNTTQLPALKDKAPLVADSVSKQFVGVKAVSEVSIKINPGEIVGLIGPNGSGKTTLLNMLSAVTPVTSGSIQMGSNTISNLTSNRVAKLGIARTFQNIRLFSTLSVKQNVLVSALCKWPRISIREAMAGSVAAMESMGIADKALLVAGNLSYGDQRRVEIARALALEPNYLFLDEPAAGMNREETDSLMDALNELRNRLSIGLLIVDHDLPLIMRLCDQVVVLNEGHCIAKGKPEVIQKDPVVAEAYLGRKHQTVDSNE